MSKEEVKQLIADKKLAAGQVFDDISAAVDSIEIGGDSALQAKLDAALAALAEDDSKLSDELSKEAKLQAKLDLIKAALES